MRALQPNPFRLIGLSCLQPEASPNTPSSVPRRAFCFQTSPLCLFVPSGLAPTPTCFGPFRLTLVNVSVTPWKPSPTSPPRQ